MRIVDKMGELSAKAQKLGAVITTYSKYMTSDQQGFYKIQGNRALGFIKVGRKKLFIRNAVGAIKEIMPVCVLDFYVHESCQRSGIGKQLFSRMLQSLHVEPHKLGYDRPSPKLIAFLRKYYNLSRFVPQPNNYVVFNKYFTSSSSLNKVNNGRTGSVSSRPLTARDRHGRPIHSNSFVPNDTPRGRSRTNRRASSNANPLNTSSRSRSQHISGNYRSTEAAVSNDHEYRLSAAAAANVQLPPRHRAQPTGKPRGNEAGTFTNRAFSPIRGRPRPQPIGHDKGGGGVSAIAAVRQAARLQTSRDGSSQKPTAANRQDRLGRSRRLGGSRFTSAASSILGGGGTHKLPPIVHTAPAALGSGRNRRTRASYQPLLF